MKMMMSIHNSSIYFWILLLLLFVSIITGNAETSCAITTTSITSTGTTTTCTTKHCQSDIKDSMVRGDNDNSNSVHANRCLNQDDDVNHIRKRIYNYLGKMNSIFSFFSRNSNKVEHHKSSNNNNNNQEESKMRSNTCNSRSNNNNNAHTMIDNVDIDHDNMILQAEVQVVEEEHSKEEQVIIIQQQRKNDMMNQIRNGNGFIAALDQSGGSTPKALQLYGIPDDSYIVGDVSMYDKVHEMRTRIMTSRSFIGPPYNGILGAILFEDTMDRTIYIPNIADNNNTSNMKAISTAQYLWEKKHIVPFLKIDIGLMNVKVNDVYLMKNITNIDTILQRAVQNGYIYGTKMRSFITNDNIIGIRTILQQQFDIAKYIIKYYQLIPIIEPEIDINCSNKIYCEEILKLLLIEFIQQLNDNEQIILKLTLPTISNHYSELQTLFPNTIIRIVALSGGYKQLNAIDILKQQSNMIASFSRAFTEQLYYNMSNIDFDITMNHTIQMIYNASVYIV